MYVVFLVSLAVTLCRSGIGVWLTMDGIDNVFPFTPYSNLICVIRGRINATVCHSSSHQICICGSTAQVTRR